MPAAPKGEGVEAPKGEAPAEADPPAEADAAPKGEELRDAPSNGEGALVEALAASWPTILSIPRLRLGPPARQIQFCLIPPCLCLGWCCSISRARQVRAELLLALAEKLVRQTTPIPTRLL